MAKVPKTSPIWRRASIEFSEARSTCFTATGELRSSCKSRCNSGAHWFAVRNSASRGTRPAPNAIDHRYTPRRLLRARRPVLCATSVPRAIHPGAQQTVPQRFRDALLDRATAARWGRYGVMFAPMLSSSRAQRRCRWGLLEVWSDVENCSQDKL